VTGLPTLRLVQLPVPPPAALAATGNVPLAAGALGVSARVHGLDARLDIEVVAPAITDSLGDALLAEHLARGEPAYLGFSLYLWNSERSLHLAREVKRLSPRTKILVGGPEISSDNAFILSQRGFDIAVTGEAEESFAALLHALLEGRDPAGLANVAVRKPLGLSPFGAACGASFPLATYPSPYLSGLVPIDPRRSTYVETVRGCRSHCTFCFYPRSSSVLRTLDIEQSAAMVSSLRAGGAREVVFLDPTFNHRPQFEEMLEALARANPPGEGRLTFFGEVRAEGLRPAHGEALKRAGFDRLEIGLQSVNVQTLKKVKRGGNPDMVAKATRMLHDHGISLLVDLIIGLPGDTPDDVARGVDYLLEHGLGDEAQVFPLSLLPGTSMRATAQEDGVVFEPAPPYRVRRTPGFTSEQLLRSLEDAEEKLGHRLDEVPRPHLCDAHASFAEGPRATSATGAAPLARDVFSLDLDEPDAHEAALARTRAAAPGARHAALWLCARDLWPRREAIARAVDARLAVDPHCTLDVVLEARETFPLDLLDALRAQLARATPGYLSRALAHRGEDAQRRISVVVPLHTQLPRDWLDAIRALVPLFVEQPLAQAARSAHELGLEQPAARIVGPLDDSRALEKLLREADSGSVAFADRAMEARWTRESLGFGDTDR